MADFEMTLATTVVGLWLEKELVTIAYDKDVITSKPGVRYMPHGTVQDALRYDDVDGIIIPGGWNREQRPELTELLQKLNREKKLISAICAGPEYLTKAGILKDKKYTTTLTEEFLKSQDLEDNFPRENFLNENVVRDDNVITAIGRSFVDFAIEIADWFEFFNNPEVKITKSEVANHYKGL